MPKTTPLYEEHLQAGGKMVDFAGWQMPIHYGSQIKEHEAVRSAAGIFDVSHMTVIDVSGSGAKDFLQFLLANDVATLALGQALYSCMLNFDAGVIDDLIVYSVALNQYRIVVNAATREKDLAWFRAQSSAYDVELVEKADLAMLAVQGPLALSKVLECLPAGARPLLQSLSRFSVMAFEQLFIARTGYTGEDGLEILLPGSHASDLWQKLLQVGVVPAGLGARDTLRLEAGMSLYGQDMDESVTPLESGLAWTVAWEPDDREFIGRQALLKQKAAGVQYKMVGICLLDKGVLRAGQKLLSDTGAGVVTSGSYSPTLKRSIGLARVAKDVGTQCKIEIRGKHVDAEIVKYPFVRNGKGLI